MDHNQRTKQPLILIVDDIPSNIDVLADVLGSDYRIKIATHGKAALTIAASQERPDLILLDVMMPEMDGYEVCRRLKQIPSTKDIPVIFVTARTEAGSEKMGLGLGAMDYIAKPFDVHVVKARVRNHINLKIKTDQLQSLIIELKNREEEIKRLSESELYKAKIAAEKASQAKSEFLSSMSHELRTPMTAILGFSQLLELESGQLTEDQHSSVREILKAGYHLLDLINQVLDLSKIESGILDLSLEAVALGPLIHNCIVLMQSLANKYGIRLVNHVPAGSDLVVVADSLRLKQIIVNLISNAVKYNTAGGFVTVFCEKLTGNRLKITVTDTGSGLTEVQLSKLFRPFERLSDRYSNAEGAGIGLYLSKKMIETMGGSIGLSSVVGQGSRFWIELAAIE